MRTVGRAFPACLARRRDTTRLLPDFYRKLSGFFDFDWSSIPTNSIGPFSRNIASTWHRMAGLRIRERLRAAWMHMKRFGKKGKWKA